MQLLDARLGGLLQFPYRAETNRVGRARLRARRFHPRLKPVIAQGALLRDVGYIVNADHSERARADAGPAAVAGVGLDHHRIELGADNGAGGADLETRRIDAV